MESGVAENKYFFRKVMAVEDTKIDQYIIENTMKRCNFARELVLLGSAAQALAYFDELAKTPDNLPELIFLDIQMPKMNGFEFLAELNRRHNGMHDKIEVVLLTSSLDPIDMKISGTFSNIKMYLNKPLTIEKLKQVNMLLSKTAGRAEVV